MNTEPVPLLRRITIDAPRPVAPEPIHGTDHFGAALAAGRFETTACSRCGRLCFPPVAVCPACASRSLAWRAVEPGGTLFSATRVHAAPARFAAIAPYRLGIVDLDAGLRLLCLLMHDATREPRIGERVALVVAQWRDGPMLAAIPADAP